MLEQNAVLSTPKQGKKHLEIVERTYKNNTNSDYTEKIAELGRNFDYESNSKHYWVNPELSLLYGTPLYQEASQSQKLALNHLYWVGNYHYIAVSEASTSFYNLVTAGVFDKFGGYEKLCQELEFETDQESYHIRTFQKVGYKTKMALVGKTTLGNPLSDRLVHKKEPTGLQQLLSKPFQSLLSEGHTSPFSGYQDYFLSLIAKTMLQDKQQYYSPYLKDLEQKGKPIPAASEGIAGQVAPRHLLNFYTLNWGISPFMACQYYSFRYTANAFLKNQEYLYYKSFQESEKKGEFVPTPTAISYYHLLDEAFHTTISQTIAKDMYKDFPSPTAYEKFLSGLMIERMQKRMLGGLSGVLPGRCVNDDPLFMLFFYKLLKSPVFEMSEEETLSWMAKCFCQEHEGFHVALKYHQNLLETLRRFFSCLDYQWPVNREMKIMEAGGNIQKAIKNNIKSFKQFTQSSQNNNRSLQQV